jgi:hypothetical protein
MLVPGTTMNLDQMIKKECFAVCPLLPSDRFVSYCRERGVSTSQKHLEQLEKMGILFPFARVSRPRIKIKIEYVDDGARYRELGVLKEGEDWNGETLDEYAWFSFEKECALDYIKEGRLWAPSEREFRGWNSFREADGSSSMESYYSEFQVHTLWSVTSFTGWQVHAEWLCSYSDDDLRRSGEEARSWANKIVGMIRENGPRGAQAPIICQVISNRYYPHTQSDRRTFHLSLHNPEWDWYQFCRNWNAKSALEDLGINTGRLREIHDILSSDARGHDPMERWYPLVSFVAVERKKQLKGAALLAQTLYAMEHMIRLYYQDVAGEKLYPPDESSSWSREDFFGKGVPENELEFLEYLVNDFHLNPKPKLILIVEGLGELDQVPRLAEELLGHAFPVCGIEVMSLDGIDNFTGDKKIDRYGALEKFIDYHHSKQTLVFVVLDDENRARTIRGRLIKGKSKLVRGRRLTKGDYIHLWGQRSIEFSNFTDEEIARAMTQIGENRYAFGGEEISECRKRACRDMKADPLSGLFKEKLHYGMQKRRLLEALFDIILADPKAEFDLKREPNRMIVRLLSEVIGLALRNYQPIRQASWQRNQESGYFGDYVAPNKGKRKSRPTP